MDSPRLSAELLLSKVLGLKRIELYTQFGKEVPQEQLDELRGLVKRAGLHEPVAYLVGKTEFYSIEFEVTSDCLIPRPETEQLVQRAIEFLRKREAGQLVCDLCAGCGIIAVAIAKNVPAAKVIATDISAAALAVATKNIEKHNLKERIELRAGRPLRAPDPAAGPVRPDREQPAVRQRRRVRDARQEREGLRASHRSVRGGGGLGRVPPNRGESGPVPQARWHSAAGDRLHAGARGPGTARTDRRLCLDRDREGFPKARPRRRGQAGVAVHSGEPHIVFR